MYDRTILRAQLSRDEARRSHPYRDSKGILTVGVGWNLEANGIPGSVQTILAEHNIPETSGNWLDPQATWPDAAIDALLDIGIYQAEAALTHIDPDWNLFPDAWQLVLMDLCFNMGEKTLSEFKKFFEALRENDGPAAVQELRNSKWYPEVGDHRAGPLFAMLESGEVTA